MERNDVPMDLLLRCPALIDATSAEQIEEYLEPFKSAIGYRAEDDAEVEMNNVGDSDYEDDEDEELEG
jgi:hypothetical protein